MPNFATCAFVRNVSGWDVSGGLLFPLVNGTFLLFGWYWGAETDVEQSTLSDRLLQALLGEAWGCCASQLVVNADPCVIPCLSKGVALWV